MQKPFADFYCGGKRSNTQNHGSPGCVFRGANVCVWRINENICARACQQRLAVFRQLALKGGPAPQQGGGCASLTNVISELAGLNTKIQSPFSLSTPDVV